MIRIYELLHYDKIHNNLNLTTMLRNSNLFDINGCVKITKDNANITIRFKSGETVNLTDYQNEINQSIIDSMDDAIDYFCITYKVSHNSVTDKMKTLIRNKLCYQKEIALTQTSWGTLLTYENMIRKVDTQLRNLIPTHYDKNNHILLEKNKLKKQLETSLQNIYSDIDNAIEKLNTYTNQLTPKIKLSFLKTCYEKVHSNPKKSLYDMLSKREQSILKALNHSQKLLFEDMEFIHNLGMQINIWQSHCKDLENKLNMVIHSIETLVEEKEKEKENKKEQSVEILDSWEDF